MMFVCFHLKKLRQPSVHIIRRRNLVGVNDEIDVVARKGTMYNHIFSEKDMIANDDSVIVKVFLEIRIPSHLGKNRLAHSIVTTFNRLIERIV